MKLEQKTIVPIIGILILLGTSGYFYITKTLAEVNNLFVSDMVKTKIDKFYLDIDARGTSALQIASLFSQNPDVLKAFELANSGDIDKATDQNGQEARVYLRSHLSKVLKGYSSLFKNKKLKLHFHLKNGRSLLRAWRDKQTKIDGVWTDISDDISSFRKTVLDVNNSGKPVSGIELGRGGFAVRGVAPVQTESGEQLGSVEVLLGFSAIFNAFITDKDKENLLLFMNKDLLGVTRKLQDRKKYPIIDEKFVLVAGDYSAKAMQLIGLPEIERGINEQYIDQKGNYIISSFPVMDYKNKQVGVIAYLADNSNIKKGFLAIEIAYVSLMLTLIVVLSFMTYFFISKFVLKPVIVLSSAITSMGSGDLSISVDDKVINSTDKLGEMARHTKNLIDKLSEIIFKVLHASEEVSSASENIANENSTFSKRTEDQAAFLEETASSMKDMKSSVHANADIAKQATQLTEDAKDKTNIGHTSVKEVVESMLSINEASKKIGGIIDVMNDISFQTNLLALNASTEAARAGKYGKGFAVVAVEVRKLAQRSSEAAKEIGTLIQDSNNRVDKGMKLAKNAGVSLEEISKVVQKVHSLVAEISEASDTQESSIAEVYTTITTLDENIQQNASLVEESALATSELANHAKDLDRLVHFFKLHKSIVDKSDGL